MTLHITPDNSPPTLTLQPGSRFVLEVAGVPEIADILDAAGIAPGPDVVGRVRDAIRRLEAATSDRDSLVGKLKEVRGERDSARDRIREAVLVLDASGAYGPGRLAERIASLIAERNDHRAKVKALDDARADLARRLEQAEDERDALKTHRDDAMRVIDAIDAMVGPLNMSAAGDRLDDVVARVVAALTYAREELAALRPKPTGSVVEWRGLGLYVHGYYFGEYHEAREGGWWGHVNGIGTGPLPNEPTARAVLLALADQPCGKVRFGVRDDALVKDLDAARDASDLGRVIRNVWARWERRMDDRFESDRPADVRAWVAHGQRVLTIEAVTP